MSLLHCNTLTTNIRGFIYLAQHEGCYYITKDSAVPFIIIILGDFELQKQLAYLVTV